MSQQERREAERRQQEMALHQNNLTQVQGRTEQEQASLVETTVESELAEPAGGEMENLRAKDLPLAKFEQEDKIEQKWLQEIVWEMKRASYPHPKSVLQGTLREWAFDDPTESAEALDPEEYIKGETYQWGTYSRATRAEDGFQQEINSKQISESVTRSPDRESSSGGLLGRFKS